MSDQVLWYQAQVSIPLKYALGGKGQLREGDENRTFTDWTLCVGSGRKRLGLLGTFNWNCWNLERLGSWRFPMRGEEAAVMVWAAANWMDATRGAVGGLRGRFSY